MEADKYKQIADIVPGIKWGLSMDEALLLILAELKRLKEIERLYNGGKK